MKKKFKVSILFLLFIPVVFILSLGFFNKVENVIKSKGFLDPTKVDNNWQVGMKFVDDGSLKDSMSWNATKEDEIKNIILQFNYKNGNAAFAYQPGELKIVIYNDFRNYKGNIIDVVSSSTGDDPNVYDWKLVSSGEEIVIENNIIIEETANFEGSVQIAFRPIPSQLVNGTSFVFDAYLYYNDTVVATANAVNLDFTSTRDSFSYNVKAEKIQALDGLPSNANDYIWVKYTLTTEKKLTGVREIKLKNTRWNYSRSYFPEDSLYFLQDVPNGAIALDDDLNQLTVTNGKVKLNNWRTLWYKMYSYVTIGYPKAQYEHATINSNSEVHGIYWDETEDVKLNEATKSVNLDNFQFVYTGVGDGGLRKIADKQSKVSITKAALGSAYAKYGFQLTYLWGGVKEDVEIGDDYVWALNDRQEYVRLTSDEYYFTSVTWSGSKLYNASEKAIKAYDLELWVRYAGETEYTKYGNTLKANVDNTVSFPSSVNVQAYKWIVRDVVESIKPDMNSTQAQYYGYVLTMYCNIRIHKEDLNTQSRIINFAYIKQYQDGEWVNQAEESNYAEGVTRNEIAPLDLSVHGDYLKRVACTQSMLDNAIRFQVTKKSSNNSLLQNDITNEQYTGQYTITTQMDFGYGYTDEFLGVEYFDLLPKGMNFSKVSKVNAASSNLKKIKTVSGVSLNDDYLEDHFNIEVKENYNGTGRTLVKMAWDFTDDPLDLSIDDIKKGTISGLAFPSFVMDVFVPYESFLENGVVYNNTIYMEPIEYKTRNFIPYSRINDYNGVVQTLSNGDTTYALKEDIDLNGNNTLDYMFTSTAKLEVIELYASHQDLLTLVETDQSNFNSRRAISSTFTNYIYKLRVRPSNNDITNLIIYDNLETAYGNNKHWEGEFVGIDTTYAESQGYVIDVYYSEKVDAGSLSTDRSWALYDETTVDKSKVKSLAFRYLDGEGNYVYIPAKTYTYVAIKMKAPIEDSYDNAYNNSWTEWTAYDNGEIVTGVNGIVSNIVEISLPRTKVGPHPTVEDLDDPSASSNNLSNNPKTDSPNTGDYISIVLAIFVTFLYIFMYSAIKLKQSK